MGRPESYSETDNAAHRDSGVLVLVLTDMHTIIGLFAVFAVMVQGPVGLDRGDWVRIKSRPNSIPVRIVAVSGDRIQIAKSGLYLNGVAVPWISRELLSTVDRTREPEIIPADHYFIVGQARTESRLTGRVSCQCLWGFFAVADLEQMPQ
jgi:hypothetical protein